MYNVRVVLTSMWLSQLQAIELWETSLLWQHTSVHYSLVALIILLETDYVVATVKGKFL